MTGKETDGTSRWRLESVTIHDFRGVLGSQVFEFDGRPALIWGNNGVGKSTLALAIEWTLFGAFPSNALSVPRDAFMSPVGRGSKVWKGEVIFVRGKNRLVVRRDAGTDTLTVECGGEKKSDKKALAFLE